MLLFRQRKASSLGNDQLGGMLPARERAQDAGRLLLPLQSQDREQLLATQLARLRSHAAPHGN